MRLGVLKRELKIEFALLFFFFVSWILCECLTLHTRSFSSYWLKHHLFLVPVLACTSAIFYFLYKFSFHLMFCAINWERSAFYVVCSAVFLFSFKKKYVAKCELLLKRNRYICIVNNCVIQYETIAWVTCLIKTEVHVLGKCYFVFLHVVLFKLNFLTAGLRWLVACFFSVAQNLFLSHPLRFFTVLQNLKTHNF